MRRCSWYENVRGVIIFFSISYQVKAFYRWGLLNKLFKGGSCPDDLIIFILGYCFSKDKNNINKKKRNS